MQRFLFGHPTHDVGVFRLRTFAIKWSRLRTTCKFAHLRFAHFHLQVCARFLKATTAPLQRSDLNDLTLQASRVTASSRTASITLLRRARCVSGLYLLCFQWPSDRPGLNSQYLKDACVHICECFFLQLSRVHDLRGVFLGRKSSIPFSTVFSRTTLARNTRDCFLTGLRPRRVPTFQLPNLAATATFAGRDYRRVNEVVSYRLHCVFQDVGACMPCTLIELVTHSDRSRI